MAERSSKVTTWAVARELPSGVRTAAPVVSPELCAFGDGDEPIDELTVFLAEHLASAPASVAARYFVPGALELRAVAVPLDPGAPTRARSPRKVEVLIVLVPHGPEGRDRLAVVPALDAAFFVDRKDDVDEVAVREIGRLCAAGELDSADWRRLLPALDAELVAVTPMVRFAQAEVASGERLAAEERRRARAVLDKLATPMTERVRGGAAAVVGRDRELASVTALLGGRDRLALLLTGDEGVGKTAVVEAWARAQPQRLAFVTSVAQLVAGASAFGEAEARVTSLFAAAERLDAVLSFEDFGSLFRERVEDGGLALTAIVRRFVVEARVRIIAEITPAALERAERREVALIGAMTRLPIAAMDPAATLAVVTARAAHWRRAEPRRPQVTAAAVAVAVELARRYLPYRQFPGKAVAVLDEVRAAAEGEVGADGAPRELGPDAVYDNFALATGVPGFLLRDDRALIVGDVIAQLATRMIGQDRAVARVAETLCTVKAQLQPADKPLATFLFVGPTGVGKTELAKSLAHLAFGSAARLVRFDMSEYADPWAAERLIRGSDSGEGLLTARIRQQPFAVVLLDEIEKAHPAVHDLLLQVAGEGRLTDARGRTAYFHNAIVILTSNLGAHGRGGAIGLATGSDDERDRERELARYRTAVTEAFRPEMLNRLDAIIPFHRLDRAQIAAVARLALGQLAERRGLVSAQLTLDVSEAAAAVLAEGGYAPAYGVRALRRHLDQAVIAPAARLVARLGRDAHGALLAVRTPDEPLGVELPAGAHLGSGPVDGGVVVSAWRRGGAGGRRNARGAQAVAAARRIADTWMRTDLATEVAAQVAWLKAQLARGEAQPGGKKRKGKAVLSSAQVQAMSIELARLERAWDEAHAAQAELGVAEELAIAAALAGDEVEAAVEMVEPLLRSFARAMFWLAVSRRVERDDITLALSAPEHPRALGRWVTGLLGEANRRGWTITAHATLARDPSPTWPAERMWGPPRSRAWLADQTGPDGGLRNALVRVRGAGAACLLGLEAGAHRFFGIAKDSPCHLVVRRAALATEFTDEQWLQLAALVAPAVAPRGPVEREYPDDDFVIVRGLKYDLPWAEQWARLEEVALAVIAAERAAGRSVDELYPVVLVEPDDADGDDDEAAP